MLERLYKQTASQILITFWTIKSNFENKYMSNLKDYYLFVNKNWRYNEHIVKKKKKRKKNEKKLVS